VASDRVYLKPYVQYSDDDWVQALMSKQERAIQLCEMMTMASGKTIRTNTNNTNTNTTGATQ
jgi:hypothetical protein